MLRWRLTLLLVASVGELLTSFSKTSFYARADPATNSSPPNASLLIANVQDCPSGSICLEKCCPDKEIISWDVYSCITRDVGPLALQFKSPEGQKVNPSGDLFWIHGLPNCSESSSLLQALENEFLLLPNGSLYHREEKAIRAVGEYCMEHLVKGDDVTQEILACFEHYTPKPFTETMQYAHAAGLTFSCICIVLTLSAYFLLPEVWNLQWTCLIIHLACLLVANLTLVILIFFSTSISHSACVTLSVLMHTAFLATFFWLSVVCFDIWRVINSYVSTTGLCCPQMRDRKRLYAYSLYAWGSTAIIMIVSVTLNFLPGDAISSSVVRPNYGTTKCWMDTDQALLYYFYSILCVLFALNLVFITMAAVHLYRLCSASRSRIGGSDITQLHQDLFWQRFLVFAVLIVSWVTEIISWKFPTDVPWMVVTDLINSLQGFFIFLIFTCIPWKKSLIKMAFKKVQENLCSGYSAEYSLEGSDLAAGSKKMKTEESPTVAVDLPTS